MALRYIASFRAGLLAAVFVAQGASLAAQTYTPFRLTTTEGSPGVRGSQDGSGTAAQFFAPAGVAVDMSRNLYVADSGNSTIREITPGGVVTTLAGTPMNSGYADGTGAAAQFSSHLGVAVDGSGNVFVADGFNDVIRKITPGGVVTTYAGMAGHSGGYADGPAASAQFDYPTGVAVDSGGNVYVADTDNAVIRKITPGGMVTTLAGNEAGEGGSADGTGIAAQFSIPSGVAVDDAGNVYVADTGNDVIRVITPAGVVTTLAGAAGNQGTSDGTGLAARFNAPTGVAVDAGGNVFVADSGNSTIRRIAPGGVVTTLAGLPGISGDVDGIGPQARLGTPAGLAADGSGGVYVADSYTETIRTGYSVTQAAATVTLGNLYEDLYGNRGLTVTTNPAGLQTVVTYSYVSFGTASFGLGLPLDQQGSFSVFATIVDTSYTGSANGVLNIGPNPSTLPAFTVRHATPGGSFLWGIAAGPGGLVAVGVGGTILGSGDGSTWVNRVSGTANWLVGVAYGEGQYIAVGDQGCILISPDGVTWTSVAQSATTERLNNVIYAEGQYVAVGEAGAIITSPDGHNWTARASGATGWLRGLAFVNQINAAYIIPRLIPARFVATGEGGNIISSPDGVTWANDGDSNGRGPLTASSDLEALASTGLPDFTAVGDNGALAFSLVDFTPGPPLPYEVLTVSSLSVPVALRGLVQGSVALFATGENGTILTATTAVGPWSQVPSGTTANLVGGVAIGDSVFVVGDNETILQSTVPDASRLTNLSCRTQVGTGGNILIAGFVVGGQGTSGSLPLLVRASGPALIPFNVPGTLPDPELQLYGTASGSDLLATNTGWAGSTAVSAAAAELGAFAWPDPLSHDAAFLQTLPVGPYTANISGESVDSGIALAEVYDATPPGTATPVLPRLVNLSARAEVGTGGSELIAGFVIGGAASKTVLIRASGPALVRFGVPGTLADPSIQLYASNSPGTPVATNIGWAGDPRIATAAAWVGAFSWGASATSDAALLVTLAPGAYTANVSGASGDSGVALIEVYEVQ
jgi:sugar lactone lactonase YvrE